MPKIALLPPSVSPLPVKSQGAFTSDGVTYRAVGTGAVVMPEMFGAIGDGVNDDTAAILSAVAYFAEGGITRQQGCELYLPQIYAISDTIEVSGLGLNVKGRGWGNTTRPNTGSALKWIGSAGIPMVRFKQTAGAGIENIRLIGNSSARPSCAVEWQDAQSDLLFCNRMRNVWIGALSGYDSDTGDQFVDGIVASGIINGDSNLFEQIRIASCTGIAVDIQNPNFTGTHFDGLYITFCSIGVKIKGATVIGTNWFISHASDSNFVFDVSGKLQVNEIAGEKNHRLCRYENGTATSKLIINGGSFQLDDTLVASDGYIIDAGNTADCLIDLRSFSFQTGPNYTSPTPKIRAYNASGGASSHSIYLRGTKNIGANNLEFGSLVGTNDARNVIYEPALDRAQFPFPRQVFTGNFDIAADRAFESWRNDFGGKLNAFGGPLNVRKLAKPAFPSAAALSGSGATVYSYRVTALTWDGETDATSAATCANAAALDATHVNRVNWFPVVGARAYRVYGRTSGAEQLIATVSYDDLFSRVSGTPATPFWDDDGSLSPSGAFPTINTTGNVLVEGSLKQTAVAVATLPPASGAGAGARHAVTDALLPAFGATVAGGGAVVTPVYSDGSAWKVG